MQQQRGLWPLLVMLLLAVAVAAFFWWPRTPVPFADEDSTIPSTNKTEPSETTSSPRTPASNAGTRTLENNSFVTIVEYTNSGFNPSPLELNAGEEIRFVNKSNGTMRITTDEANSNHTYSSYMQPDTVGYNGTFQLVLPMSGLWTYYNLNTKPPVQGVVYVK